ncbi:MAG TPA: helix-turn-helix domain-containing protein [Kribbellaceae bacterium]
MDDELEVSTPEQYKALGHPMRHRLLFALGQQAATISQLAVMLGTRKGNVAHHLGVLREAGLVTVVETRQVRGGTEHYYRRSAQRLHFGGELLAAETPVVLQAVADELGGAEEELLFTLRNVRLTEEQARELADRLSSYLDGLGDAGDGEKRYGMLAAVYRPRQ